MLELNNLRISARQLDGTDAQELEVLTRAAAKKLHVSPKTILKLERKRKSIDARKQHDIQFIYTLLIDVAHEQDLLNKSNNKQLKAYVNDPWQQPHASRAVLQALHGEKRVVVVGAGCAGLFCTLVLARAGLQPLLIERGDNAERRVQKVDEHNATGVLDPESNIQFGLGGAGTFSDGKLQTGTKAKSHRFVLETFVEAGASPTILWDAKPHVGSDVLHKAVTKIVKMIEDAGGEVRFRSRMSDIMIQEGKISALEITHSDPDTHTQTTEWVQTEDLVLATGHSARDTFELMRERKVPMERKTFAMGVRIEHPQALINKSLYGSEDPGPALGAAPYKLAEHLDGGRSAFSFCMCPGGYVVSAASEIDHVVTNGMSLSDRAGENANAGLLANVFPTDLPGDDVLAGVTLQRACEKRAFELGGGAYVAPAQLVGDFLKKQPSSSQGSVTPTYPRGVNWSALDDALPDYIIDTLRAALPKMNRRIANYALDDAVLTGVETRSSSPVRITRDDKGQSIGVVGLWPTGEGAGYAGGIMSAAADGILTAQRIVEHLNA